MNHIPVYALAFATAAGMTVWGQTAGDARLAQFSINQQGLQQNQNAWGTDLQAPESLNESLSADNSSDASAAIVLATSPNPQLAMSNPDYPVTAGDVYALAYAAGTVPVSYTILVDPSYKIRVSNLAVLDARGKTFLELKTQVETVVSKNYPLSGVQFALTSPSAFQVTVRGEVLQTAERKAWALTRLSAVLSGLETPYSSRRDVSIRGGDGRTRVYDLFKAERAGDLSQDPHLRPGDTVTVGRVKRLVEISGAVRRPGVYQLLDDENASALIRYYGGGFAPLADSSRIELTRYLGSSTASGEKLYLEEKDIDTDFRLFNQDSVKVSAVTELLPVLFVEGAIGAKAGDNPEASTRIPVSFNPGENIASIVRSNRNWFTPVSDTKNAYLKRGEERIPVNLNPMLYDASFRSALVIRNNDTLVIPFYQYFVTVSGAVAMPGRYPYIPDRDWQYYVALAGGIEPSRNTKESVAITNVNGKPLKKTDSITPETVIHVKSNAFLYYFNQYAPVATTTLSLITTLLTIYAVTGGN